MKSPFLSYRTKIVLAVVGAVLFLPGASSCGLGTTPTVPELPATACSGPSSGVTPVSGSGTTWSKGSRPSDSYTVQVFNSINYHRQSNGLNKLIWHDGLAAVAETHAKDMNARNYLSIVSPPSTQFPNGVDVYQRLVSSIPRIDFTNACAYVAKSKQAPKLYEAMMANPAARGDIDNPNMTHFGYMYSGYPDCLIFAQNVTP